MTTRTEAKRLDKFYTKADLAQELINKTIDVLGLTGEELFLEPSAGCGNFSKHLKNVHAFDIKPEASGITQADFLQLELDRTDYITIGNPPFGSRCRLAVDFFEKCAKHSKAIAFVVPVTFLKWSVQSLLNKDFALIYSHQMDENSFTFMGDDYELRCCFQIWVKKSDYPGVKDLRIPSRPSISHSDFKIWQHNATVGSRKYVEEPWEIATWRQGYKDYNNVFTREDYDYIKEQVYTTNTQFFYIQPLTDKAREVIKRMDFNKLARRNMSTPGFGKADFVAYYEELLREE